MKCINCSSYDITHNGLCCDCWEEDYEDLKKRVKELEEACAGCEAIFCNSDDEYECRQCGQIFN